MHEGGVGKREREVGKCDTLVKSGAFLHKMWTERNRLNKEISEEHEQSLAVLVQAGVTINRNSVL